MPETATTKKTKYRTVQVPVALIKLTLALIPGLYRNHHEAFTEWIRLGLYDLLQAK